MGVRAFAFGLVIVLVGCGPRSTEREDDPGTTDAAVVMVDSMLPDRMVGPDAAPGCEREVCGDGLDGDCDGVVDDGCGCAPGATLGCFRGPASARRMGACTDGTMTCTGGADGEFGVWGPCIGDVLPGAEVCDVARIDEDCDGAPNDGCQCADGDPPTPCGSDVGECTAGTQTCTLGMLGACTGAVGPGNETCNNLDDDCDGTIDEGITRACGSSVGNCAPGTERCVAGVFQPCEGATEPAPERCNGVDDDCDGTVDDGANLSCGSDVGACSTGVSQCMNGSFGMCTGEITPMMELCNDVDDDCDGQVDEGLMQPCGSDVGLCRRGQQTCVGGRWATCSGGVDPIAEACNTFDDDCDGMTDEGCDCVDGASRPCGTDTGACVAGTESCVLGRWQTCTGAVGPVAETCNNSDDDCNGRVDDGLVTTCGTDVGACTTGTSTCAAGVWGSCMGNITPAAETCNNVDDDCDGPVDEGVTRNCGTDVGACVAGTQTCSAGAFGLCVGETGPVAETCNNVDDNCNGMIDERITRSCGTDTGECRSGTETCSAGMFGLCVGEIVPVTEMCNTRDDDCDGMIDEGCSCVDGTMRACGSDVGRCQAGSQLCGGGVWGTCMNEIGPVGESCNNIDDDCDGMTDELLTQGCGTDTGECVSGTQTCSAGSWGSCAGSVGPATESCNNLDDDCNGAVDNGVTRSCGTDTGECVAGTETCSAGAWGMCAGSVGPVMETCNNRDDDCDGSRDEMLTRSCGTDTGRCEFGTETCGAGSWGACMGGVTAISETCNNIDDNCNGAIDDGVTRMCGTDTGACVAGVQSCMNGVFGMCTGSVGPVPEICANGVDDDCDGGIDELADCPNQIPPVAMCPGSITTQPLQTVSLSGGGSDPDGGSVTYQWTVTTRPVGSSSQPASPNSASTTFFVDLAGTYVLRLTVTDNEGQTAFCTVTITSVPPQDLHVELVWSTVYGDADLQMTEAGVNPASAWYMDPVGVGESACWWDNTTAAWPPNGGNGNATLDIDDRDGFGPENINISQNPSNGTYGIGVSYYCSHSLPRSPGMPVAPGDGPSVGTVKIYCGGLLIATYPNLQLDRTGRFIDVARVTWPGCTGMSIVSSSWVALVQPSYYSVPIHCTIPCSQNNDCTGGEVCNQALGRCVLD